MENKIKLNELTKITGSYDCLNPIYLEKIEENGLNETHAIKIKKEIENDIHMDKIKHPVVLNFKIKEKIKEYEEIV